MKFIPHSNHTAFYVVCDAEGYNPLIYQSIIQSPQMCFIIKHMFLRFATCYNLKGYHQAKIIIYHIQASP
jgi:isoprenylcysteine carboxyl methyltransferase (ICMT) family protein YpbQ